MKQPSARAPSVVGHEVAQVLSLKVIPTSVAGGSPEVFARLLRRLRPSLFVGGARARDDDSDGVITTS